MLASMRTLLYCKQRRGQQLLLKEATCPRAVELRSRPLQAGIVAILRSLTKVQLDGTAVFIYLER